MDDRDKLLKQMQEEGKSRVLDYDHHEAERRAKISHDARFGGDDDTAGMVMHGPGCYCVICGLDRALAKLSAADKLR